MWFFIIILFIGFIFLCLWGIQRNWASDTPVFTPTQKAWIEDEGWVYNREQNFRFRIKKAHLFKKIYQDNGAISLAYPGSGISVVQISPQSHNLEAVLRGGQCFFRVKMGSPGIETMESKLKFETDATFLKTYKECFGAFSPAHEYMFWWILNKEEIAGVLVLALQGKILGFAITFPMVQFANIGMMQITAARILQTIEKCPQNEF